jgi:hypothetical protein
MQNPVYFLLLLMTCLCFSYTGHAAFPMHQQENNAAVYKKQSFNKFANTVIEKYHLPLLHVDNGTNKRQIILSIVSLALGIAGFVSIFGAYASLAPIQVGLVVVCGITAIILGAVGAKHKPLKGVSIAGFIMGIIDISAIVAIGLLALALEGL